MTVSPAAPAYREPPDNTVVSQHSRVASALKEPVHFTMQERPARAQLPTIPGRRSPTRAGKRPDPQAGARVRASQTPAFWLALPRT